MQELFRSFFSRNKSSEMNIDLTEGSYAPLAGEEPTNPPIVTANSLSSEAKTTSSIQESKRRPVLIDEENVEQDIPFQEMEEGRLDAKSTWAAPSQHDSAVAPFAVPAWPRREHKDPPRFTGEQSWILTTKAKITGLNSYVYPKQTIALALLWLASAAGMGLSFWRVAIEQHKEAYWQGIFDSQSQPQLNGDSCRTFADPDCAHTFTEYSPDVIEVCGPLREKICSHFDNSVGWGAGGVMFGILASIVLPAVAVNKIYQQWLMQPATLSGFTRLMNALSSSKYAYQALTPSVLNHLAAADLIQEDDESGAVFAQRVVAVLSQPISQERLARINAQYQFLKTITSGLDTQEKDKTIMTEGEQRSYLAGITASPMFDSQVARIILNLAGISAAVARKKGKKAFLQAITSELDTAQLAKPVPVLRNQHRSLLAGITNSPLFNHAEGHVQKPGKSVVITTALEPEKQAFDQRVPERILRLAGFFPVARATASTAVPRTAAVVLPAPSTTLAA